MTGAERRLLLKVARIALNDIRSTPYGPISQTEADLTTMIYDVKKEDRLRSERRSLAETARRSNGRLVKRPSRRV